MSLSGLSVRGRRSCVDASRLGLGLLLLESLSLSLRFHLGLDLALHGLQQLETLLECVQQALHSGERAGDFEADTLGGRAVDDGVRVAVFAVDVLGDVDSASVAFGAEGGAGAMGLQRIEAEVAVRGVPLKGLHNIELVILGEAAVDGNWHE